MAFNAVVLSKTESCLSYALRIVGCEQLLPIDYDGMVSGEHFKVMGFDVNSLSIGDIVLWDRDLEKSLLPIKITGDGKIIHSYLQTGLHYAVYEGDNILSDCVRENDYPIIRLRNLSDCRPDIILARI